MSFIRNRPERLIIDEAQYAPDLFSMIQVVSDERGSAGQYILTGSQNFLLMKNIGQSLAGRVGVLKLLPLSYKELFSANRAPIDILEFILKGGYPRLYDLDIPLDVFFPNYKPMWTGMLLVFWMCAIFLLSGQWSSFVRRMLGTF